MWGRRASFLGCELGVDLYIGVIFHTSSSLTPVYQLPMLGVGDVERRLDLVASK